MSLTLPYPTLTTTTAVRAELQDNFAAVASKFGYISNEDVRTGAGIDVDKLSAQYEYMAVSTVFVEVAAATGLTAARFLSATPMYNDGKGTWTAVAYSWYCTDVGAQTGKIDILWGYYETTGSLHVTPTVIKDGETLDGGTANSIFNDGGTVSVSLPWTVNRMMLYVAVDTADATACSALDARLGVTVILKRKIAT